MMSRLTCLGPMLVLAATAAQADPAADCSQHQDQDRRIRGCSEYILRNPRDPNLWKAHANLGLALWTTKRYDEAIRSYSNAISMGPRDVGVYHDRGTLFRIKGRRDEAISDYDKALAIDPRHGKSYFGRGNCYADKSQFERAAQDYTKVIELEPRNAGAYYNRGNMHLKLDQAERALADFNKAIELNPKLAVAHGNRGVAFEKLGRTQDALADYRKAVSLDPKDTASQANLKRLAAPSSAGTANDPAVTEFCEKAKERTKCLKTQALLQQLKTDKTAARWSDDVDFEYARTQAEQAMLFEFMLLSIPVNQKKK
jgi:tetratricopeptide (TPR) repeat protein